MTSIAIIGPEGSNAWLAAHQYNPDATLVSFPHMNAATEAFNSGKTDLLIIPVYNTQEGGILKSFQTMKQMRNAWWLDNIVIPVHFSLGTLDAKEKLSLVIGRGPVLRQCEEYLVTTFPDLPLLTVPHLDNSVEEIKSENLQGHGIIESEQFLRSHGFQIREREVSPHNKTRYAVLGRQMAERTGYDATALMTVPLKDRVGLFYDILGEFTKRGINLLDMRAETDAKTQELQIYFEAEGHANDPDIKIALQYIAERVIQEPGSIKVIGSYPRVDMRIKRIKTFGFIGTGDMSIWFSKRLEHEGYKTLLTGRSTELRPEEMIPQVDVVLVCVPISKTSETIEKYGPLLKEKQALILLAGEAENTIKAAIEKTSEGVEVMLVHNLWGPAAATMKDKNASVVRTSRSGSLCGEFEAFLYKHGADIIHDSPNMHDLLMGVGQKLPTSISVALAMALQQNNINIDDIGSHATLTSLYPILAMSRVHSQNPRTYAEILCAKGDSSKIARSFIKNIANILELAEKGKIDDICEIITQSRQYLTDDFLDQNMQQALAVDETLGRMLKY